MPKSLPLVLLLLPFCISCNRYQYATVDSPQLDKNDRNEFVFENDSLVLVYNFLGQDLGADIFIENKLSVPIYIDWRGSALIVNGQTNSYAPINVDPFSSILGDAFPPAIDFIPPRSSITKTPLVLHLAYDNTIPRSRLRRTEYTAAGVSRIVKTASFSATESPLQFRSYISYMVGKADGEPRAVEHAFYVSDVMNTVGTPRNILQNGNHGNQFYTSKITTGGGIGAGLVLGAVGSVILALQLKMADGPN